MGLKDVRAGPSKNMARPLSRSLRDDFIDFLASHHMEYDPKEGLIEHGRGKAWSAYGGRARKDKGWYLLFLHQENPLGLCFDWREGDHPIARWSPDGREELTDEERERERQLIEQARKEYQEKLAKQHAEVAKECRKIWKQAAPCEDHPYLERKKVANYGLRVSVGPDFDGYLILPYRDETKQIVTLSYIPPEAGEQKWWHKGAKRKGTYALIGPELLSHEPERINYVEGYATGASWYEHVGEAEPVIITGDANGMVDVPKLFAEWFPDATHVFIADNDENETGQKAAQAGANEVKLLGGRAEIIVPGEVGQDFNDVVNQHGIEGEIIPKDHRAMAEIVDYAALPKGSRLMQSKENYAVLLEKNEIDVAYNVIKKEMEIDIPDMRFINDLKEDAMIAELENRCIKEMLPHERMRVNLPLLAREHNPVKDWMESVPWDGTSRIQQLLDTVDAEDNPLKEMLMRKWLAGCAAVACLPQGANLEGVLIFVGRQAIGKTQWMKSLAPNKDWLLEGATLNPSDKDSVKHAVSHWIVELGELGSTFKKADIDQLKAFLTKSKDELRLPYGRSFSRYQRRTAFYGSVNEREFLVDPTGNRRFWVVHVNKINFQHGLNMQQIWAEVLHEVYQGGETWFLTSEERERLQVSNENSRTQSVVEDLLLQQVDFEGLNTKPVQMAKLLTDLGIRAPRMSDYKEASRILQERGIKPRKSHGKKIYDVQYEPVDTPTVPRSTPDF